MVIYKYDKRAELETTKNKSQWQLGQELNLGASGFQFQSSSHIALAKLPLPSREGKKHNYNNNDMTKPYLATLIEAGLNLVNVFRSFCIVAPVSTMSCLKIKFWITQGTYLIDHIPERN